MKLIETFKQEHLEFAWWVEILTARPYCTYYFGPFESAKEAVLAQDGYIEDLVNEEAQGIAIQIKWCKPRQGISTLQKLEHTACSSTRLLANRS